MVLSDNSAAALKEKNYYNAVWKYGQEDAWGQQSDVDVDASRLFDKRWVDNRNNFWGIVDYSCRDQVFCQGNGTVSEINSLLKNKHLDMRQEDFSSYRQEKSMHEKAMRDAEEMRLGEKADSIDFEKIKDACKRESQIYGNFKESKDALEMEMESGVRKPFNIEQHRALVNSNPYNTIPTGKGKRAENVLKRPENLLGFLPAMPTRFEQSGHVYGSGRLAHV